MAASAAMTGEVGRESSKTLNQTDTNAENRRMAIIRILSGVFLLAATLALIAEATQAQLGVPGAPFTPLLAQLTESAPQALHALERTAQNVHPLLWDPAVKSILSLPAWISLGSIGLVLSWLGRRRRQAINVFTN